MIDGDCQVGVGNVTVPADQPILEAGSIVEVRYLYAYLDGSLFQPVLLGVREAQRKLLADSENRLEPTPSNQHARQLQTLELNLLELTTYFMGVEYAPLEGLGYLDEGLLPRKGATLGTVRGGP